MCQKGYFIITQIVATAMLEKKLLCVQFQLGGKMSKPKEKVTLIQNGANGYLHYCPGCKAVHRFVIGVPNRNGLVHSLKKSENGWTVYPDIVQISTSINEKNVVKSYTDKTQSIYENVIQCHYWIINGKIEYLQSSKHDLAQMKVELPSFV